MHGSPSLLPAKTTESAIRDALKHLKDIPILHIPKISTTLLISFSTQKNKTGLLFRSSTLRIGIGTHFLPGNHPTIHTYNPSSEWKETSRYHVPTYFCCKLTLFYSTCTHSSSPGESPIIFEIESDILESLNGTRLIWYPKSSQHPTGSQQIQGIFQWRFPPTQLTGWKIRGAQKSRNETLSVKGLEPGGLGRQ